MTSINSMSKINLHFLIGTSAVGKTSLLSAIDSYFTDLGLNNDSEGSIQVVATTVRKIRKEMGNPTYQDILDGGLSFIKDHQDKIMNGIKNLILNHIERCKKFNKPVHIIFDRSLFDVAAYSAAFQLTCDDKYKHNKEGFKVYGLGEAKTFHFTPIDGVCNSYFYHLTIDPNIPYGKDPARPPEYLRDAQQIAMSRIISDIRAKQVDYLNLSPNIDIFNESAEIQHNKILDLIKERTENVVNHS